jgi:alkylated DNA repair dioxygenase AlkB
LICSLSLGASRRFAIRPRDRARRAEQMEWSLGLGDVLVMYGDSQQDWEHAVLKTQTSVESRINITFRSVTGR